MSTTELQTVEATALPVQQAAPPMPAVTDPMELISHAVQRGADIATIERLMDIRDRMEREKAERAFRAAFSAFQRDLPSIHKNRDGDKARYADLDAIVRTVNPLLGAHGLSYTFDSAQELQSGWVHVTCIIEHDQGHKRETKFSVPVDVPKNREGRPSMNSAQGWASANSYARRYALMNALGIATGDHDDDGHSAGPSRSASPAMPRRTDPTPNRPVSQGPAEGRPTAAAPADQADSHRSDGNASESAPASAEDLDWSGDWRQGRVENVQATPKKTRNGDGTLFSITFNGQRYTTFSESLGEQATEAAQSGRAVWVKVKQNGQYWNIEALRFCGDMVQQQAAPSAARPAAARNPQPEASDDLHF